MIKFATLAGYIPYTLSGPTFLVPLFLEQSRDGLRVQAPTDDGANVADFLKVDGLVAHTPVEGIDLTQTVGAQLIYGFRFSDGQVSFEYKSQLVHKLMGLQGDDGIPLSIKLQIASLGSTSDNSNVTRNEFSIFAKGLGSRTFISYLNSSMRMYAWDRIESGFAGKEILDNFWEVRSYLDFFLDVNGAVRFQDRGSGIEFPDGFIEEIIKELGIEFDSELKISQTGSVKRNFSNFVGRAISKASNYKRQEERLAVLLGEMLEQKDPEFVFQLIDEYRDRAKFANESLELIRKNLEKTNNSVPVTESIVADLLPRMYNRIFWSGQAYLLYAFAKRLGQYKAIRAEIEEILYRNSAEHVLRHEHVIRKALEDGDNADFEDDISLFHFTERNTKSKSD